ncbi:hypothetical protein ACI65C_013236 [Semiaphis heraclei]
MSKESKNNILKYFSSTASTSTKTIKKRKLDDDVVKNNDISGKQQSLAAIDHHEVEECVDNPEFVSDQTDVVANFKEDQYVTIVEGLEEISKSNNFNSKTRQRSYEMLTAITTPTFVVILSIMAKYSAKFKTVSTLLQAVDVDLQEATKHIQDLLSMLEIDRNNCENRFNIIFNEVKLVASKIDLELKLPRRSIKQVHRENYPTNDVEIYFRQ